MRSDSTIDTAELGTWRDIALETERDLTRAERFLRAIADGKTGDPEAAAQRYFDERPQR